MYLKKNYDNYDFLEHQGVKANEAVFCAGPGKVGLMEKISWHQMIPVYLFNSVEGTEEKRCRGDRGQWRGRGS
jgi:hypothetical protein